MAGLSPNLHELNILLAEPSSTQRRIIIQHLREAGVTHIDDAATVDDAITRARINPPDLVASAMYFDDRTGTDLLVELRRDPRLGDVPFMLVSSERHPHNLEGIRQSGVMAILPKPFRAHELRLALDNTLSYLEPRRLELDHADVEDVRVLIVDDSALSRRFLRNTLGQMGVEQLVEADNGASAVERLQEQSFDLVVTDYNMPEMDGERLVEYIRNHGSDPTVPVLMVTCERDSARLGSIRQSGVSALCDKPFDMDTVRGILHRLLN
ncbi:two-component system chemotaxis response regulator CheY [Natronocella acetinitrilica]|jgi:two-component system, chemotaxis family, chemotaxis protein CheY|uniref:Two-component system chemotaxis response regulator CheY n=1 Tax=Natronocella acetinitrilica TaxID=414046 RepID=A0AAE3G5F5_9GAMM|nr:response regulator [Natronocella acetinitrilica]MCP1676240.1 two-component system chemotaxis response regulator CheY [Natronocella acetinitrilica]